MSLLYFVSMVCIHQGLSMYDSPRYNYTHTHTETHTHTHTLYYKDCPYINLDIWHLHIQTCCSASLVVLWLGAGRNLFWNLNPSLALPNKFKTFTFARFTGQVLLCWLYIRITHTHKRKYSWHTLEFTCCIDTNAWLWNNLIFYICILPLLVHW